MTNPPFPIELKNIISDRRAYGIPNQAITPVLTLTVIQEFLKWTEHHAKFASRSPLIGRILQLVKTRYPGSAASMQTGRSQNFSAKLTALSPIPNPYKQIERALLQSKAVQNIIDRAPLALEYLEIGLMTPSECIRSFPKNSFQYPLKKDEINSALPLIEKIGLENFQGHFSSEAMGVLQIQIELEKWCHEPHPSTEKRLEAKRLIWKCLKHKKTELNLDNFELSSLPSSFGNLKHLTTLSLKNNNLTAIPESLANLSQLRVLQLENNQLRSIPERILRLPSTCQIHLTNNPFSTHVYDQLQIACGQSDTPTIHISTYSQFQSIRAHFTLDQMLNFWNNETGLNTSLMIDPEALSDISLLNPFLKRLEELKDFRNPITRQQLAQRIMRFIKGAIDNAAFKEQFSLILEDSLGTCGDRVNYALNMLECQWKILCQSSAISTEELIKLAIGMKRIALLQKIANEKARTLRYIDEIEVHLAYQTQLSVALELPIETREMLYFGVSGVTESDLQNAAFEVQLLTSTPESIINLLASFDPWQKWLKQHYPRAVECIEEIRIEEYEKLETQKDNLNSAQYQHELDLLQARHITSYEDITKIVYSTAAERTKIEALDKWVAVKKTPPETNRAATEINPAPRNNPINQAATKINRAPRNSPINQVVTIINPAPRSSPLNQATSKINPAPRNSPLKTLGIVIQKVLACVKRAFIYLATQCYLFFQHRLMQLRV